MRPKLNNENFLKFGYIMESRVFLKYIEYKNGVTVFFYEKMSIHFSEERFLIRNLLDYQCARALMTRVFWGNTLSSVYVLLQQQQQQQQQQ